jgi:hypothetical protein
MSSPNGVGSDAPPTNATPRIQRLLFVADAAVADVDELPPVTRAIIDAATDVYVLTPTLPGRLAWLADEVDRFRHYADERLDTVLGQMRAIGADAGGAAARGSVVTVIADAVTAFEPDHILIALHVSARANWQERRLIEHVENRFRLPVTTFGVDPAGHTRTADGPLLLCYDGSDDAKHAIEHAGRLLGGREALVVTVWQPTPALGNSGSAGATDGFDFVEVDSADLGERVARDGVRRATGRGSRQAGRRRGHRTGVEEDRRDRRPPRCRHDRHGSPRTDRSATAASGERLERDRAPRRPTHADRPPVHPGERPLPTVGTRVRRAAIVGENRIQPKERT